MHLKKSVTSVACYVNTQMIKIYEENHYLHQGWQPHDFLPIVERNEHGYLECRQHLSLDRSCPESVADSMSVDDASEMDNRVMLSSGLTSDLNMT